MRLQFINRRLIFLAVVVAVGIALSTSRVEAATSAEVEKAIGKAKVFLYAQQKNGNWDLPRDDPALKKDKSTELQWGGWTAIATYALLASGEDPLDPRVQQGVEFLKKADIGGIYALGLRAQVWQYLGASADVREAAKRDANLLMSAVGKTKEITGFYNYHVKPWGNYHHSTSQYGVLGMWACAQVGIEVPNKYWKDVEQAWRGTQQPDGGWSYLRVPDKEHPTTASMTAAGVATLFITADFLHSNDGINCKGDADNVPIDRGLKWISDHFADVKINYTWYGIERIGVASGYKYLGTVDWYAAGAEKMVRSQKPDGSWGTSVSDTSFALLFLSRGRAPVVMNKLQYEVNGKESNWNQRPRDAANITQWLARQTERDLNWQIVNLKASPDDLHDSQILYVAGKNTLVLMPEDEGKLRTYVQQGGMILGNADCADSKFAASFRALGTKLFPTYEFRELPASHIVYSNHFPRTKWTTKPSVLGLSNGVRELMLLIPQADPAKNWQLTNVKGKEDAWQLLFNLFFYSVDRNDLRFKGQTYIVKPEPQIKPDKTISLARLEYPGNWDPEPGGWKRLAAVLHNTSKITLNVQTVKLGEGKLKDHKLAHLTGTTTFKLTDAQRDELKAFVTNGGTLIVDCAGGSTEFQTSAEATLRELSADAADALRQPLPATHPIYAGLGQPAAAKYRNFSRTIAGNSTQPMLRGVEINKRLAMIFSREDLSAGLVGQSVDGIHGYDPATATVLMSSILLHAAK